MYAGVFAVGRSDLSVAGRRLAAVLACGPGALLSHLSAAAHRGLRDAAPATIHVTVPHARDRGHAGVRAHLATTLRERDRDVVDGIPCTSVARTLLDVASASTPRELERMLERAEILEVYDHRAVVALIRRSRGMRGVARLRAAVLDAHPGETITASGLEERMLRLCRRWGLPVPSVNEWILLSGEWVKVDFHWREQRVVVETDGYRYHRTRAAFRRDRRRDRLLEVEGYGHARFADEDFDADLPHVRSVLERLLGA